MNRVQTEHMFTSTRLTTREDFIAFYRREISEFFYVECNEDK